MQTKIFYHDNSSTPVPAALFHKCGLFFRAEKNRKTAVLQQILYY